MSTKSPLGWTVDLIILGYLVLLTKAIANKAKSSICLTFVC